MMLELSSTNSAAGGQLSDIYPWLVGAWALVCGYVDLSQRRIPNSLILGAIPLAIAILLLHGHGALGFSVKSSITACLVALVLTLPAYLLKWLGAGDVKMLFTMALLTGLQPMLLSFVFAAMLALVSITTVKSAQRRLPYLNLRLQACGIKPLKPLLFAASAKRFIPFGSCLAAGLILSLLLLSVQPALLGP